MNQLRQATAAVDAEMRQLREQLARARRERDSAALRQVREYNRELAAAKRGAARREASHRRLGFRAARTSSPSSATRPPCGASTAPTTRSP